MKKFYISGPITGRDPDEASAEFKAVEDMLTQQGHQVVNPFEIVPEGSSWNDAMEICLGALEDCTDIIMLPYWYNSRGAVIERNRAVDLRIVIHHHPEEEDL